jgi:bis(5'-nucleosidyl)-tetraphosphatase
MLCLSSRDTMNDTSYGVIPLFFRDNEWQLLLVKHISGHWSFPKGHAEGNELPKQAAARELKEETGLDIVEFFPAYPMRDYYEFRVKSMLIKKTVIYFLATVQGELKLQTEEISEASWCNFKDALNKLTFSGSIALCQRAREYLEKHGAS